MKKALSLLLILSTILSLGITCFADSIYVPDDQFYNTNYEDCDILDRKVIIAEGSVAQSSPTDRRQVFKTDANFIYNVSVTYTDPEGTVWLCIEKDNKFGGISGWVPMTAATLIYDNVSFEAEHSSEFTDPDGISPDLSGGAVVYEYPLSPEKWVFGSGTDFADVGYKFLWTDENGVNWLYVPYHYGIRGWICADNPLAGYDVADNTDSEGIVLDAAAPKISGIHPSGEIITEGDPAAAVPHTLGLMTVSSPEGSSLKTVLIALGITLLAAAGAVGIAVALIKKKKA